MKNNERLSSWITGAPSFFTVAEAEAAESRGVAWAISGDLTTIEADEDRP